MDFSEIQTLSNELESSQSQRNKMFEEIEKMYLLEPTGLPDQAWIKKTVSPDPRNAVVGANRLLTATEPKWSVPATSNTPTTTKISSDIEKACKSIWNAAGRVAGKPIHVDAALSAVLYGEVHLSVMLSKDLLALAKSPADKLRRQAAAQQTPLMFEVINPSIGYPLWDRFGLAAYFSRRSVRVVEVRGTYGQDVLVDKKNTDTVDLCEYWDLTYHCVWVGGQAEPLLLVEHGLPAIPIIAVIAEGSTLFYKPEQQQRQPMLYSMWKSGLWDRQNLSLTVMYSLIFAIGSNPLYIYKRNDPGKQGPQRDYTSPGGLVTIDRDEDFTSLAKQTLDPSLLQGLSTAQQLGEASTIYRQTLGEPLGANAPFSMVALLSQAGRQPLIPYQRMTSFAIAQAMRVGLLMLRDSGGGAVKVAGKNETIELDPKQIPDTLDLTADLDIAMPQDDRQSVAVASQATSGNNPLMSMREARNRFLNIGQSDDMDDEIAQEKMAQVQVMLALQKMQAEGQAQLQAYMQQQQQRTNPIPQPGGHGGGGAVPPDMAAQLQGQLQSTGAAENLPGMPAAAPLEPQAPGGAGPELPSPEMMGG